MTPSEKFVAELSEKSFLPFWSFPSPLRKKNKELCDLLVVCENIIIIISIKDIKVSDHPDENIQFDRWHKKAIQDSIKQIYGAERFINDSDEILLSDIVTKIKLPHKKNRELFRIAIAFGKKDEFPLETGEFGQGFVHVFDEESTMTVFSELDTIRDFVSYLRAKEEFLSGKIILVPREVDFLGLYLATSLRFEFSPDSALLDRGIWEHYTRSAEYRNWQLDLKKSYIWDEIVFHLYQRYIVGKDASNMRSDLEIATRIIALEPRINRIELGMIFLDAIKKGVRGRIIQPFIGSNHTYVIMPLSSKNWDNKESELQLRCLIARRQYPNTPKVIGIAIGKNSDNDHLFDIAYFDIPEMTTEVIKRIDEAKVELGFFTNTRIIRSKDISG